MMPSILLVLFAFLHLIQKNPVFINTINCQILMWINTLGDTFHKLFIGDDPEVSGLTLPPITNTWVTLGMLAEFTPNQG